MSGYSISDALAHSGQAEPGEKRLRPRRGRRWALGSLAVLLVAGAGATAARYLLAEEDVYASPETVDLPPPPDDAAPTREYISGPEGALVRALLDAADQALAGGTGTVACETAIATLDGTGAPQQVFAAAQGLPDPASAEMAVRHASALSRFLGICISEGAAPDPKELVFTSTIMRCRLDELG